MKKKIITVGALLALVCNCFAGMVIEHADYEIDPDHCSPLKKRIAFGVNDIYSLKDPPNYFLYGAYKISVPQGMSALVTVKIYDKNQAFCSGGMKIGIGRPDRCDYSFFKKNESAQFSLNQDTSVYLLPYVADLQDMPYTIGYDNVMGFVIEKIRNLPSSRYWASIYYEISVEYFGRRSDLKAIAISGASKVKGGISSQYICKAIYSDGVSRSISPTWSISAGSSYATINSSGVLTAKSVASNRKVTVKAVYGDKVVTFPVTISKPGKTLKSIAITGAGNLGSLKSATYSCTATYSDGSKGKVSPTWTISSGSEFASMTSAGVLKANAVSSPQNIQISAQYLSNGVTATATYSVAITPPKKVVKAIEIQGEWAVNNRDHETYVCTATYSDGSTVVVVPNWSLLSESKYASIDSSGVLTTMNAVSETQVVTLQAYYGGVSALKTVLIRPDFTIYDGELHSYSGEGGVITIPAEVTEIGYHAFENRQDITSVEIPEGVTVIGSGAFFGCTGLTSVVLPSTVETIDMFAFQNCSNLVSITLPTALRVIGSWAFDSCVSLRNVSIPPGVTVMGDGVFSDCEGLLVATLPPGMTKVNEYMFASCSSLKSVSIPQGVTSIEGGAFTSCTSLSSVTIPPSVTNIGAYAFSGCKGLRSMSFPSSVRSIGDYAFSLCTGLETVILPLGLSRLENGLFSHCENLRRVTMFSNVESIEEYAFYSTKLCEVCVEKRDAGRVKDLFIGSGHSVANLGFLETAVPYLSMPPDIEVTDNRYDCLHIEWTAVSGVSGYRVYRKAREDTNVSRPPKAGDAGESRRDIVLDPGELIADVRQNCYDDYEVSKGHPYVYCVAAYLECKEDVVVSAYASADGELRDIIEVEPEYRTGTDIGIIPVLLRNDGCEMEVKVSGLPEGLKFALKDIVDRKTQEVIVPAKSIYGIPAKSGIYPVTVRLTPKDRKSTAKAISKTVKLYVRREGECAVDAVWESTQGKVVGIGMFKPGKKVTLKATAKKGYVFSGWYDCNGSVVSKSAKYSFAMPSIDLTYNARFVTVAADRASIAATVGELAFAVGGADKVLSLSTNAMCGVALSWPLSHWALSATSVKVTGLPKGLKYDSKKKVIAGAPTAPGKTSSVKIAVTTAGKTTVAFTLKVKVSALPEWSRGQFTGNVVVPSPDRSGQDTISPFTMTVGTTGKVSGKFKNGITNWTFLASSFAKDSVTEGDITLVCRVTAKGAYKNAKKKTVTVSAPIAFEIWADPDVSSIAAEGVGNFAGGTDNVEIWRVTAVKLAINDAKGGTVKMDKTLGQAASGKKVKLTATPKKGYAFLGWFDVEGNLVSQSASYSRTMAWADVFLTAKFKKETELAAPVLDWNAPTNLTVGVSYSAKPKASGEAAVKIASVSGLPAGLAYASGKVSGVPTTAKTNTVSVKVALKTNAKKTWTLKQRLVVEPLPAWAKGTYHGGSEKPMQAKLTVASTGKASGKLNFAGAVWTLTGTKYSKLDREARTATMSLTATKGTTKKTVAVTVGADELGGWAASETSGFAFEARQNLWKADGAWAACAAALAGVEYADPAGDLTVLFGAGGAATAKLKVGKNTFSASATLCPAEIGETWVVGRLYLYFAPDTKKKFKGAVRIVDIEL